MSGKAWPTPQLAFSRGLILNFDELDRPSISEFPSSFLWNRGGRREGDGTLTMWHYCKVLIDIYSLSPFKTEFQNFRPVNLLTFIYIFACLKTPVCPTLVKKWTVHSLKWSFLVPCFLRRQAGIEGPTLAILLFLVCSVQLNFVLN